MNTTKERKDAKIEREAVNARREKENASQLE